MRQAGRLLLSLLSQIQRRTAAQVVRENHSDTFLALVQVLNLTQEAHLMPITHSIA